MVVDSVHLDERNIDIDFYDMKRAPHESKLVRM